MIDAAAGATRRLLITAGPTHEPIDAVRYIGNRSSGKLGIALAEHAADSGWDVRLLLGPTCLTPADARVEVSQFESTDDLSTLLEANQPWADVLVMAAAVADYRVPRADADPTGKLRRTPDDLALRLESTPDLLKACSARRNSRQLLVGFALEPAETMLTSAAAKLERKGIDAIVANPLGTMEADTIEATLLTAHGQPSSTDGAIAKADFAPWLLGKLAALHAAATRGDTERASRAPAR